MTEIQKISPEINRMISYAQAPMGARRAAARPPVQIGKNVPESAVELNLETRPLLLPENKIPKVEEIKEMIKNNGYPFKSAIYKALERIVENDLR